MKPWLKNQGFSGELHPLGLLDPEPYQAWGGFLFARSIYRPLGPVAPTRWSCSFFTDRSDPYPLNSCSLRSSTRPGHRTGSALDALICSSRAGRDAVLQVLEAREDQLLSRTGGSKARLRGKRLKLPVIPLLPRLKALISSV